MSDLTHLDALNLRLSHERCYLANAKTERERELRRVWIRQIEREITSEMKILGIEEISAWEISDEDLLAELTEDVR